MSAGTWEEGNNRYLAESLEWLRLRLLRLATQRVSALTKPYPKFSAPGELGTTFVASTESPPNAESPSDDEPQDLNRLICVAEARRAAAAEMQPPPALLLLSNRLGLSEFEREVLLLCAGMEFDSNLAAYCMEAHGNTARNFPTFGLAFDAFESPSWEALSAHRPLRYARLVEICQPGATPLTSSPLRADERIVNFLKGLNALDERLATLLTQVDPHRAEDLTASQEVVVETILLNLHDAVATSDLPVVQLLGIDPGSKFSIASAVCAALGRRLYRIDADSLPAQSNEIEVLARLWQRESLLLPVALYIDAENSNAATAESRPSIHGFVSRLSGMVFLGLREGPLQLLGSPLAAEVNKPTPAEQCAAWAELLSPMDEDSQAQPTAEQLAGQFNLNLGEIRSVVARASTCDPPSAPTCEKLWNACRDLTRPRLDSLAQRLDVKATWDDLVLPEDQMHLMRQIAAQVRERHRVYGAWGFASRMNRGFGITALFAGESGTGKTMAAEVIASDLNLSLYRIDLSSVVSKYIGETEKNLRRLFDAAELGGAILLFDEADALFGKRSEVKDSHDRYANIEINYLLQRMEAFSGLAILATNMKSALDTAFLRRLRFVLNFKFPSAIERKKIWQRMLPAQTPKHDLDYERLARLNITGGTIHSITLNAAFLAAANGGFVTMPILLSAARCELRKLEKPFSEAEFRT
jgi:hypothetical protein